MIFSRWFRPIRLSSYMIVRNVVRQGYPYLEAIHSVLPWCDEFLVQDGFSSDETWIGLELLREKFPDKIRLFREKWEGSNLAGEVLATMSNRLRTHCRGRYCLNLQANEVVPPSMSAELAALPATYPEIDLFKLPFLTFMGFRLAWMQQYRARLFRNDSALISLGDAYDVGVNPARLRPQKYRWHQVDLRDPIHRYRGLYPLNFIRKTEGRTALFMAPRAQYFAVKELSHARASFASFDPTKDSPDLFWRQMQIYLEDVMWRDNPEGMYLDQDTVRQMLGWKEEAFRPLAHLSTGWEYDVADSFRRL